MEFICRLESGGSLRYKNNWKYTIKSLRSLHWRLSAGKYDVHLRWNSLWQLVSGCIAIKKNLRARGIQKDTFCARCGAPEESINHVYFECPPAVQFWALSRIPSNPDIWPTQSFFANMDHLFWRVSPKLEDHRFAWILWYIRKRRNNKVFSNFDIDPRNILN